MNTKLFLAFIIFGALFINTASAGFILSDGDSAEPYNSGYVRITSGDYTWAEVVDYVNTTKGQTVTEDQYFIETSPGVWFVKVRIQVDAGASIDVNFTDVDIFRTAYQHSGGSYTLGGAGTWLSDGVTYQCWDENDGAINVTYLTNYGRRFVFGEDSYFTDCIFNGATTVGFGTKFVTNGNNTIVDNCEFTNWSSSILYFGDNITFESCYLHDPIFTSGTNGIATGTLTDESHVTNCNILNCTVLRIGNVSDGDSSGTYGIWTEGYNNHVSNCTVDGIRYVAYNLKGNYSLFEYLHAHNATHNIIEAQASNSVYRNVVMSNSGYTGLDSALFTALEDDEGVGNVTFENIYIDEDFQGSGGAIRLQSDGSYCLEDYVYRNITSGHGDLYLTGVKDILFDNVTMEFGEDTRFQLTDVANNASEQSRNIVFLDSSFLNASSSSLISYSYNISFANSIIPNLPTFVDANYTVLYPPNVLVTDNQSNPIANANVTLNVTTFGLNGLGEYSTTGITGADGKLNYSQRLYVPDYLYDGTTTSYTFNRIEADYQGLSNYTAYIDPEDTWYTPTADLLTNDYNGTLFTIVLDVEGGEPPEEPLSITTSSPSGATISIDNETALTTSITVNKESNITTYLDTVLVQTNTSVTTATYVNDSMTVGTHNLTMLASVGGESVNRVWMVTVTEASTSSVSSTSEWESINSDVSFWNSGAGMLSLAMILLSVGVGFKAFNDGRVDIGMLIKISIAMLVVTIVITIGPGIFDKI